MATVSEVTKYLQSFLRTHNILFAVGSQEELILMNYFSPFVRWDQEQRLGFINVIWAMTILCVNRQMRHCHCSVLAEGEQVLTVVCAQTCVRWFQLDLPGGRWILSLCFDLITSQRRLLPSTQNLSNPLAPKAQISPNQDLFLGYEICHP